MKFAHLSATWLATLITYTTAKCSEEGGNWYCDQVDAITYANFGRAGSYQKVTSMANGHCGSTAQSYAGGMSPLDGEISWHFRGPMRLKQFAYYTPGSSVKRDNTFIHRRQTHHHDHQHLHAHRSPIDHKTHETWHDQSVAEQEHSENIERREPSKVVTATIDGKIVSWIADAVNTIAAPLTANTKPTATPQTPSTPSTNPGAGKWGRQAYYNAEKQVSSGLVFLNHKGGQSSGVFDYTWGNSLSYASSDVQSGAASPQILADALLADNNEIAIFSSRVCNDTSCGTVRPGTVAHHGFDGASKLFLLEFSMPLSGTRSSFNADMPAAWILNAQIPRTMQYGPAECSCWKTGCGEWDIYEVLDAGNKKCKSTFHAGPSGSGGDSNWFARPTEKTVKVAVLFDGPGKRGVITNVPDGVEFGDVVDEAKVGGWVGEVDGGKRRKFELPL